MDLKGSKTAQNLKAAITEIYGSINNLGFKKFHQVDF